MKRRREWKGYWQVDRGLGWEYEHRVRVEQYILQSSRGPRACPRRVEGGGGRRGPPA